VILPNSEIYIKSGLAKSAFNGRIYRGMPLDYFIPGIDMTYRLAHLERVAPKFYQSHDAFLAFFTPIEAVAGALKLKNRAAPAWRALIEGLVKRPEFIKVNRLTQGSMALAAAAAARMLIKLGGFALGDKERTIDEMNQIMKQLEQGNTPPGLENDVGAAGGVQNLLRQLERDVIRWGKAVAASLRDVAEELIRYKKAVQEAESAAFALAGGHGYTLEGLSIWHFYEKPNEFRRHVKVLVGAALAFRHFMRAIPASLERAAVESRWGGIDGVARMTEYSQLREVLPTELAVANIAPVLFALKLAQMSLNIHKRAATVKPVIFLDKSGSMAEVLTGPPGALGPGESALREFLGSERIAVPKISLAAGLALALYRKTGGEVYLFDTEVERVSPRDVVGALLRIQADGGTNIGAVMEEVMRIGRPDHIYLIVSDGITDAPKELVNSFIEKYGPKTKLILVPPSEEGYGWVQALKALGNVAYANDVAEFEEAAKRLLTSAA
jgi:hypothetical protein